MRNDSSRIHHVVSVQLLDVVVGTDDGAGGLSGGQKRRLAVAMELLTMPSIIFLESVATRCACAARLHRIASHRACRVESCRVRSEPTSGLDSTSALEVVKYLHSLSRQGHAIVLTIHQVSEPALVGGRR